MASKPEPYHAAHRARDLKQRVMAGGVFTLLYGASVTAAIWAGVSMLAIETAERHAQWEAQSPGTSYPTADQAYWPMFYMLWASLPLVWIWWSWRPARFSGGGLKRALALGATSMGVTALFASVLTLFTATILVVAMGLLMWPMVTLVVALTLWLSDKFWGSTHP